MDRLFIIIMQWINIYFSKVSPNEFWLVNEWMDGMMMDEWRHIVSFEPQKVFIDLMEYTQTMLSLRQRQKCIIC